MQQDKVGIHSSTILTTAGQLLTQGAANNLTSRRLITVLGNIDISTTRELRLECDGVDSISVETFINDPSDLHEVLHRVIGNNNVHGCKRLLLIQAPDMKLVN